VLTLRDDSSGNTDETPLPAQPRDPGTRSSTRCGSRLPSPRHAGSLAGRRRSAGRSQQVDKNTAQAPQCDIAASISPPAAPGGARTNSAAGRAPRLFARFVAKAACQRQHVGDQASIASTSPSACAASSGSAYAPAFPPPDAGAPTACAGRATPRGRQQVYHLLRHFVEAPAQGRDFPRAGLGQAFRVCPAPARSRPVPGDAATGGATRQPPGRGQVSKTPRPVKPELPGSDAGRCAGAASHRKASGPGGQRHQNHSSPSISSCELITGPPRTRATPQPDISGRLPPVGVEAFRGSARKPEHANAPVRARKQPGKRRQLDNPAGVECPTPPDQPAYGAGYEHRHQR